MLPNGWACWASEIEDQTSHPSGRFFPRFSTVIGLDLGWGAFSPSQEVSETMAVLKALDLLSTPQARWTGVCS